MSSGSELTKRILVKLGQESLKSAHSDEEYFELRLNKFILKFGIFTTVFGLLLVFSVLLFPVETGAEGQETPLLISGILFLIGGIYFFCGYYIHRIKCKPNQFTIQSFYGKKRKAKWTDIKEISFKQSTNLITIHLVNGQKLKFSQYFIGLLDLFNLIEKKSSLDLGGVKKKILMISSNR